MGHNVEWNDLASILLDNGDFCRVWICLFGSQRMDGWMDNIQLKDNKWNGWLCRAEVSQSKLSTGEPKPTPEEHEEHEAK